MKIVKCGYAAKENFEVKIIVLHFGCIFNQQSAFMHLVNKVQRNIGAIALS